MLFSPWSSSFLGALLINVGAKTLRERRPHVLYSDSMSGLRLRSFCVSWRGSSVLFMGQSMILADSRIDTFFVRSGYVPYYQAMSVFLQCIIREC